MASDPAAWRGVHPLSVLVNFVPRIYALLRSAWPVVLMVLYGGRRSEGLAGAVSLVFVFGLPFLASVVHALTLRYRVAEGRLEIRSGLVNRQARAIALERIQNVERVQNVFQRASGLVEVRVETASGAEVEGLLSAISVDDADRLVAALSRDSAVPPADAPAPEVVARYGLVDLVWAGAVDPRLGALSMLLAVVVELQPGFGGALMQRSSPALGVAVVGAALSGGWLLGIAAAVVRYQGFTLSRTERSLLAVHGLLTRRRTELRRTKVQQLVWTEPLLARLFGLGTLAIETAAAREEGSGTERAVATVPYVEPGQVGALVAEALPGVVDPATVALSPPDPRALPRTVIVSVAGAAVLTALATWFAYPWGLVVGLSCCPQRP
ncbi:MAG: PH domain-containing protein [Myxococcota bacterium]